MRKQSFRVVKRNRLLVVIIMAILLSLIGCGPEGIIERTGERYVPELACNRLSYEHVNLPDGVLIEPFSGTVEKVWSVKNEGICDWDTSYGVDYAWGNFVTLVYDHDYPKLLPHSVERGETFELPLTFETPCVPGWYYANFYLSGFKEGEEDVFGGGYLPDTTVTEPIHWDFQVPQYLHLTDVTINWYSIDENDYIGPCPVRLDFFMHFYGYMDEGVDRGCEWVTKYSTSEGYLPGEPLVMFEEYLNMAYPLGGYAWVRETTEEGQVYIEVIRPDHIKSNTLTYSVTCIEAPPPPPPATIPEGVALRDVNCREKPGDEFKAVGFLPAGESAPIIGRNLNFTWLLLNLPDLEQNCWVWKELLIWEGDLEDVEVIPAEQIEENGEVDCSGLGELECKANSQCQWIDEVGQPAYCKN